MSFLRQIAKSAGRRIARSGGPTSRFLYKMANEYVKAYNNLDYDIGTNGERYIIDCLAKTDVRTVFDVGANVGSYTRACLSRFKDARIHAFEIATPTFDKLIRNFVSSRVIFNNFGLSNSEGTIELHYSHDDDGKSSLISDGEKINGASFRTVTANVTTGDRYCQVNSIRSIDLLKIDVEGAEHLVLEGFTDNLERGVISAVQFEFGMINIYTKFLLKDFWEFFSRYGFEIGPIMPRGVAFKDYNPRDENFQGPPNFFAVHKTKPMIKEAVKLA
jgi:FkbM family methyltransferase